VFPVTNSAEVDLVDLVDGVDRVDVVNRRDVRGCGARVCFCSLFANVVSVGEASRPLLIQDLAGLAERGTPKQ
jgi:hypothetical protein